MRATESDARKIIENWGAFVTEVAPLTAPILLLIRSAAAADPEMADLLETADRATWPGWNTTHGTSSNEGCCERGSHWPRRAT